MWKKKLTFMLIPGASGILKQLRVPVAAIYLAIGAVVTLVFVSFFFSAQFFSDKVSQKELDQLRADNEQLKQRFEQMRWHLAQVEDRYQDLVQKEVYLRSLFDLPAIEQQERELGVGGPEPAVLASMSATGKSIVATERQVDWLLKLSEFEIEKFGEVETSLHELKDRLSHTPSIWPTKGWVSRGFGMKYDPFTGYKQMHHGIDVASHRGTPVIATADGRVRSAGRNSGMGKMVVIDHGYGFRTRYGHLAEYHVTHGQKVKRGDVIGLMGSTGYSTGPHLHYEVVRNGQTLNPMKYILNQM